ncbi:MAG: hypothetical protein AAFR96_12320 [Planctomycetota bacterium]
MRLLVRVWARGDAVRTRRVADAFDAAYRGVRVHAVLRERMGDHADAKAIDDEARSVAVVHARWAEAIAAGVRIACWPSVSVIGRNLDDSVVETERDADERVRRLIASDAFGAAVAVVWSFGGSRGGTGRVWRVAAAALAGLHETKRCGSIGPLPAAETGIGDRSVRRARAELARQISVACRAERVRSSVVVAAAECAGWYAARRCLALAGDAGSDDAPDAVDEAACGSVTA